MRLSIRRRLGLGMGILSSIFIQKPFNMKELSQKLREILDGYGLNEKTCSGIIRISKSEIRNKFEYPPYYRHQEPN